ncbi:hypothetical protein [Synechococcus elongatus]|uniref:hypothetical protein n=1 Tax=Synechococcus elongatus TaxID=32046 RepID=UPI000F7EE363|nr:hypothetical protein [Synechococcus elongatus]
MIEVKQTGSSCQYHAIYFICDRVDQLRYVEQVVESFGVTYTTIPVNGRYEVWPACCLLTGQYIREELGPNVVVANYHEPEPEYNYLFD